MMNFNNRRDKSAPPADTAKPVLKPAIYDPPVNTGHASGASGCRARRGGTECFAPGRTAAIGARCRRRRRQAELA